MLGSHKMMEAPLAWEKPHGTVSPSFSDTDDTSSFPHLWNEVYRPLLSTAEQLLQTSLQLPLFLTLLCTGWLPWDPVSLSCGPSHKCSSGGAHMRRGGQTNTQCDGSVTGQHRTVEMDIPGGGVGQGQLWGELNLKVRFRYLVLGHPGRDSSPSHSLTAA